MRTMAFPGPGQRPGSAPLPPDVPPAEPAAPAAEAAALPVIRVVAADRRELVESLSVNGTIVAREEAAAGADLNGLRVVALHADIGDRVRKGDVLAVLDRSMLDTQLARAKASRAQAEANVAQMRAQIADASVAVRQAAESLARARALEEKGIAARRQLDDAVNAADSARARLVSAEKALAAAEAQLGVIDAEIGNVMVQIDKTELRAPADGVVLARDATLGMPALLLPSIQVNVRAGRLPAPEDNGTRYLKIPLDAL